MGQESLTNSRKREVDSLINQYALRYLFCLFALLFFYSGQLKSQEMNIQQADSLNDFWSSNPIVDFRNTLPKAKEAFLLFSQANDTCKMAEVSNVLASCYDASGVLDSALQILLAVRRINLDKCDPEIKYRTAMNLSSVYLSTGDFDKVTELCESTLSEAQGVTSKRLEDLKYNYAIALANLGNMEMAGLMFEQLRSDAQKRGDAEDEVDALINLGVIQGIIQNVDSAEACFLEALEICQKNSCSSELYILRNLATIAFDRKEFRKQLELCERAILRAKEVGNFQLEVELEFMRSEANFRMGNYDEAWSLMENHRVLRDSLLDQEKVKALAEVQEKYESEKKVRQIKELEVQNLDSELRNAQVTKSRNRYLFGGILLLIMAVGLFSRLHLVRRSRAAIKKEKDRSESLLLNILPEEVAEELKEKGAAEAQLIDPVTVVFTDFKGFTTLSEKLSPQELVNDLNTCFSEFDRIMGKYGIEKIKTNGDAYMAAGGLPIPSNQSVKNTVSAALEMQTFISERKTKLDGKGLPAFEMRVGIHTGPVVAGIVGVKKFQYDIWGDTVNTASRMESNGEVGKVNISQATYNILKDDPQLIFERRGKVEAKGKGELEMFFVGEKV
jgi:adenylate cyclase